MSNINFGSALLLGVGAFIVALLALMIIPIITTAVGALAAVAVNWMFPSVIGALTTMVSSGVGTAIAPWQLGAMLGFVGGFFKARLINNSSSS